MSKLRDTLLIGPTFASLSGERRKAFIRQWFIGAIISVISALFGAITLAAGGKTSTAIFLLVALLALQLMYALIRGETVWQLRIREWKARSEAHKSNQEELIAFAEQLKRGHQ